MNRETVNEAMEVEVPNGFYVLSAEELRLAYQSEDPNRWGMRDKERHIILTVMWKEYRGLPVLFLPGLKSVLPGRRCGTICGNDPGQVWQNDLQHHFRRAGRE